MPDDSTPAQRNAQSAHAAQIKFERQLMRSTGLSRGQVRDQLNRAQSQFINRTLTRVAQPVPPKSFTPVSISAEQGFRAGAITGSEAKGGDGSRSNGGAFQAIVLNSGLPQFAQVSGILGDFVPA